MVIDGLNVEGRGRAPGKAVICRACDEYVFIDPDKASDVRGRFPNYEPVPCPVGRQVGPLVATHIRVCIRVNPFPPNNAVNEVPVVTKELSDRDTLEIALIENLQRENLTPLEEADAYQRLMDEFSHTQEALAQVIGKSRSHVANMLRLLTLPERVKEMVDSGILTAGHARTLVNVENPEVLAQQIAARGLNVRQAERLAQQAKGTPPKASGRRDDKDADTLALERDLSGLLGLKVNIRFFGKGGSLTINYKTLEQLDDVLHRLSQGSAGREAPLTLVDEVVDGIDVSALASDPADIPEAPST